MDTYYIHTYIYIYIYRERERERLMNLLLDCTDTMSTVLGD